METATASSRSSGTGCGTTSECRAARDSMMRDPLVQTVLELWPNAEELSESSPEPNSPEPQAEAPRRKAKPARKPAQSDCDRILALLQEGPATHIDLSDITPEYKRRVVELRELGHDVSVRTNPDEITVYRLGPRPNDGGKKKGGGRRGRRLSR